MKSSLSNIIRLSRTLQHSFATRISIYVLIGTALLFATIFSLFYYYSSRTIEEDARKRAWNLLDNTTLHIEKVLESAESIPTNLAWQLQEHRMEPEQLYNITREILRHNPQIFGCAISFEPNYYPEEGYYFSPYAYRKGNSIMTKQLGNDAYDYFCMDWYQIPRLLAKPYWTEPYFGTGGSNEMVTTYSVPMIVEGKVIGIVLVDISLEWLSKLMTQTDLYDSGTTIDSTNTQHDEMQEHGYSFIVGRNGTYVYHYQADRILNSGIFSETSKMADPKATEMAYNMVDGKRGEILIDNDGVISSVFYAPILSNGWSVATVYPRDEMFAPLYRLRDKFLVIVCTGIVALFIICFAIIRHSVKPLHKLALSTRRIAEGNFDVEIPAIKSADELGELHDSFHHMQTELKEYISNLQTVTSAKEKMESELRIARDIQMGMVPKTFPPFPTCDEVDIYAYLCPAREVGGDLYDFFLERNEYLYFAIGDVSGKGVPASLLMAVTRTLWRSIAAKYGTPHKAVTSINDTLSGDNESSMFVTFFMGVLNMKNGHLTYCNAGHNPPLLQTPDGKIMPLPVDANLAIGVFGGYEYTEQDCDLQPGSRLLLYTDGVTEAENASHELYGDEALAKAFRETQNRPLKASVDHLLKRVEEHVLEAEASDDMTLMLISYKGPGDRVSVVFKNNISEIDRLEHFMEEFAERWHLSPTDTMNLNLALEEAIVNCIHYAYPEHEQGEILLHASLHGDVLTFVISDAGIAFDPTKRETPDLSLSVEDRPIGGLGIFLVKQIMDTVEYQRHEDRNVLIMTKKIQGDIKIS